METLHWWNIFFIWSATESQLLEFHELVNASSDALTFTMDVILMESMWFLWKLDLKICCIVNLPTIICSCMDHQRPVPLKRSLPISQFSRIHRICSKDEDYQQQAEILAERVRQSAYKDESKPPHVLEILPNKIAWLRDLHVNSSVLIALFGIPLWQKTLMV